jgi:hypothetical protein
MNSHVSILPAREADEPFRATRHTYIIYYQCSLGFLGISEDCFIIHEEICTVVASN